tara:strand:+ start:2628 stop:4358 length:1731 start_codon:yes stop_codon:yes gene_type:complete
MAVYDTGANSSTAITAWLAQFKVASSGAITFVSGTDTFHVKWINRALQKLAWDFIISGDDEINLSKPNPSKEEALGKIVTLNDHTTDFSVNYTVTDTVMQSHFGGSVSQNNGDDIYYGLQVLGSSTTPVPLKIIQNEIELTSHWGTGKNQTDSNTQIRVMVKGRSGGADIDGLRVVVKASTWLETYAIWETTLGLGESVASISTDNDPQNTTLQATVEAYSITKSEGYNLLNIDGAGNKPYLGNWSYDTETTKKALYEFVKAILVDGTTNTLYGVDGDLWTGRLYDCVIDAGTGTHIQNETCDWVTGNGNMVGVDDLTGTGTLRYILHLGAGVPPVDNDVITGLGGATATVAVTVTKMATSPNHLAQFTGAWIGALGIGFLSTEVGSVDSFKDLDGNIVTPPNNVTVSGTIEALNLADDLHVFLAPKDAVLNAPDYTVYTCVGEIVTSAEIRVNETISPDTPQAGWFGVLKTGTTTYKFYEYSSWDSGTDTFNLVGTVTTDAITASDAGFHAIFYESMTGGGTTKSISNTLIYTSDIAVRGWIRHGDASGVDKVIPISGTIGSAGFNFTGTMEAES